MAEMERGGRMAEMDIEVSYQNHQKLLGMQLFSPKKMRKKWIAVVFLVG